MCVGSAPGRFFADCSFLSCSSSGVVVFLARSSAMLVIASEEDAMKWGCRLSVVGCRLSGERGRERAMAGLAARPFPRQPTTDNRQPHRLVIHTSFENSFSFGSAARA